MKRIILSLALLSIASVHAISFQDIGARVQDIGAQVDVQLQRLKPELQRKVTEFQQKAMQQANVIRAQQAALQQAQMINDQRAIEAAKREIKRAQELYNDFKKKITDLGIDTRKLGLGL